MLCLHTVGEKCHLIMTPNPQDRVWVFEAKDLGSFQKVMGLSQRWNSPCASCAARFFERIEPSALVPGKESAPAS